MTGKIPKSFMILEEHDKKLNAKRVNKSEYIRNAIDTFISEYNKTGIDPFDFKFRDIDKRKIKRLAYIDEEQDAFLKDNRFKLSLILYRYIKNDKDNQ